MAIYRPKILAIAVLLLILALTLPQAVSSAEGLKLSAVRDGGDVGGQVTVTVRAENVAGTEGGQFLLTFDPNLVKPVSSEAGELVAKAKSNLYTHFRKKWGWGTKKVFSEISEYVEKL